MTSGVRLPKQMLNASALKTGKQVPFRVGLPFHWLRYSCTTLTSEYSTRKETFQIPIQVLSKILEPDSVRSRLRFGIGLRHRLATSIAPGYLSACRLNGVRLMKRFGLWYVLQKIPRSFATGDPHFSHFLYVAILRNGRQKVQIFAEFFGFRFQFAKRSTDTKIEFRFVMRTQYAVRKRVAETGSLCVGIESSGIVHTYFLFGATVR